MNDPRLDLGVDRRKAKVVGAPATGTNATSTMPILVCAKVLERSVSSSRTAIHHAIPVIPPTATLDQISTDRAQLPMSPWRHPRSRPSPLRSPPLLQSSAPCGLNQHPKAQKLRPRAPGIQKTARTDLVRLVTLAPNLGHLRWDLPIPSVPRSQQVLAHRISWRSALRNKDRNNLDPPVDNGLTPTCLRRVA